MHPTKTLMLVATFLSLHQLHAQSPASNPTDSTTQPSDSITNKSWYKILNRNFARVATGQGEAVNLVNYGSFDPVAGAFKFNIYGPLSAPTSKKMTFFNITAGGKLLGDNLGVLFTNSKFNAGLNINGKIHIPLWRTIFASGNEIDQISRKIELLEEEKRKERAKVSAQTVPAYTLLYYRNDTLKLYKMSRERTRLQQQLDSVNQSISRLRPTLTDSLTKLTDSALALNRKISQLYADSVALRDRADSLQELVADRGLITERRNQQLYQLDTLYKSKRAALETSVTINRSHFAWLSPVGSFERRKYYTLIDSLPFSQHFRENRFSTYYYGLEFNFVGFTPSVWPEDKKPVPTRPKVSRMHIVNLGVVRLRSNDIDNYTTTELAETKKYALGDSTRTTSTKYQVYPKTITEYEAWRLYLNYYYSLGRSRSLALHFFPDVEFRDTEQNPFNLGLGLVVSFKNKKDNALLNLEAYGRWKDAGKALPQEVREFWNRNEIGLKFGIPIYTPGSK